MAATLVDITCETGEMVDMADLKSVAERRPGSSPGSRIYQAPILLGQSIKSMPRDRCCYCNGLILSEKHGERRAEYKATMDHVMPRGRMRYPPGLQLWNKRPSCADCNTKRSKMHHCTGMLMMALIDGVENRVWKWGAVRRLLTGCKCAQN